MVNVFIERENKVKKVNAGNPKEVMRILNINPETVLIVKNNELVMDEESLDDNDNLRLLSVISGG